MSHGIRRDKYGIGEEQSEFIPPTHLLIEMDGALVNSMSVLYNAYEALLQKYDLKADKNEFKKTIGLKEDEYLLALSDFYGLKGSLQKLQDIYQKLLTTQYREGKIDLFAHAQEFLQYVQSIGLTITLIAAAPGSIVKPFLKEKKIDDFFDLVVTSDSYTSASNQYLNSYHFALINLGINPLEAVAAIHTAIGIDESLELDILTFSMTHRPQDSLILQTSEKLRLQIGNWSNLKEVFQEKFGLT
jgi:beta-phosphoglucomutase-like phosphatase (HAD superfamily)